MMSTIAIVEDDPTVFEMLQVFLIRDGYKIQRFSDSTGVIEYIQQTPPDLLLLDWMLPGVSGITLLQEIRKITTTLPIIMLTAKDDVVDLVIGLEGGADDYVTKPFSPFALLARIKAHLRRMETFGSITQVVTSNQIQDNFIAGQNYQINLDTREVVLHNQMIESLTPKEFDILVFLARHPKHVFSREQLIETIWGYDYIGDDRTVDAHIKRLRRKISTPPYSWIHTVWGSGYKFDGDIVDET
ncbi:MULTISPECIES: response regulator transcription factor [Mesobacillus]|nr:MULTISPECIES: response regulator transcription factor [Mesobacillus]